jgi:hypothetical protein
METDIDVAARSVAKMRKNLLLAVVGREGAEIDVVAARSVEEVPRAGLNESRARDPGERTAKVPKRGPAARCKGSVGSPAWSA